MIDLFQPLEYKISQPIPDEISAIQHSSIEKFFISRIPCSDYFKSAQGFFRFKARHQSTKHNEYVNSKTLEIYEAAKQLDPDSMIIRIDYLLKSGLMVGVYIREDLRLMLGFIAGYRPENMTEEEFEKPWYGSSASR